MLSYETDTIIIFKLWDPEDRRVSSAEPTGRVRDGEGRAQVLA